MTHDKTPPTDPAPPPEDGLLFMDGQPMGARAQVVESRPFGLDPQTWEQAVREAERRLRVEVSDLNRKVFRITTELADTQRDLLDAKKIAALACLQLATGGAVNVSPTPRLPGVYQATIPPDVGGDEWWKTVELLTAPTEPNLNWPDGATVVTIIVGDGSL